MFASRLKGHTLKTESASNKVCVVVAAQVVYSEFLDLVRSGNVKQARIDESLQKVYFSVQPRPAGATQDADAVASTSGTCCFWMDVNREGRHLSHPLHHEGLLY